MGASVFMSCSSGSKCPPTTILAFGFHPMVSSCRRLLQRLGSGRWVCAFLLGERGEGVEVVLLLRRFTEWGYGPFCRILCLTGPSASGSPSPRRRSCPGGAGSSSGDSSSSMWISKSIAPPPPSF